MNVNDLYEQRDKFYLNLSGTARGGLTFCLLTGIGAFGAGLYFEPNRAWGAFLFNLFFFFTISLGGVAFGAMQDIVGAVWARPIKRLHESFSSFLVPATVLLIAFFAMIKFRILGADQVYPWIRDPSMLDHFEGKKVWLTENFMIGRDIGALLAILALVRWQMKQMIDRDMALVRGQRDQALQMGLLAKQKLRFWAGPILFAYAVLFSLLCFDLTMSLQPLWYSTLWGGWSFAVMMHSLMALMLIIMFTLKDTHLGHLFNRQQFHDVGKLMHGFTAFFGYLTYAHILTYWYGNVPEETEFFMIRLHAPWLYFILALPFLIFIFPIFALIPKAAKWTAPITLPIAICIFTAQWLSAMMVVMPATANAATWVFPWLEFCLFLGFLSIFIGGIFRFGKKIPMLCIADPLLPAALVSEGH
jgi:hypothetical protein